jgi:hypothetical protein
VVNIPARDVSNPTGRHDHPNGERDCGSHGHFDNIDPFQPLDWLQSVNWLWHYPRRDRGGSHTDSHTARDSHSCSDDGIENDPDCYAYRLVYFVLKRLDERPAWSEWRLESDLSRRV